ncbi:hypothetical protein [Siminovitchia sp. 179-K 8D1 HS]|uniref:hypothetical protein n=1 Tax=Siminovitchia sp. 179-K 8D1 HS TaxID=3142385 RepID=UPI0039A35639
MKEELTFRSETEKSADLQEQFSKYYENRDPADYEAIALFYAGFMFFGISIGALIGFLGGGWQGMFLSEGWIDTIIGAIVGFIIGMDWGFISNGMIALKQRKKSRGDICPMPLKLQA